MKRLWIFNFMIGCLLSLLTLVSPVGAAEKNFQSFVLGNEGTGLIGTMVAAGYGNYSLYDALVIFQTLSDPSIAGVLTDAFLATLAICPAGSGIFAHKLNEFNVPGISVAVNEDGTIETVNVYGSFYVTQPETSTLASWISGIGLINLTHSPPGSSLTSWTHVVQTDTIHYHAFAVAWTGYRLHLPLIKKAAGN
jgi:hypothetical protein